MKISCKLTVLHEQGFWIGVFEHTENATLTVSRVVFGAEPREVELLEFIEQNYYHLRFGVPLEILPVPERTLNPKRRQRMAQQENLSIGIGTKAQQAIKATQEAAKLTRRATRKEQAEARKKFQFELKQQKRKEKHRGH